MHTATGLLISLQAGGIASGLDPLQGILASGPIVLTLWGLGAVLLVAAGASEASLPQPLSRRAANPLLLTLAFTAIGSALPLPWRDLVTPAALNLAHLAFFASLLGRPRG